MSTIETFLWGLGGAAAGYSAIVILPIFRSKAEGRPTDYKWTWLLLYMIIYSIIGGFLTAAFIGGDENPKNAVTFGMSWVTLFRGVGEGSTWLGRVREKRKI